MIMMTANKTAKVFIKQTQADKIIQASVCY